MGAPGRTFAIGDIHGCADELDTLLTAIAPQAGDVLCFLGDYVDRGPASRHVIDLLLQVRQGPADCIFLRGNHEDMLIDFLGMDGGRFGDMYLENGGAPTLRSYGLAPRRSPDLIASMPPRHVEFIASLTFVAEVGNVLCVHAGLRPSLALDRQRPEDLLWIREEFYGQPHRFGRIVIYGHTPRRVVEIAPPYRIGLDTGLVYGGSLSCLHLEDAEVWQVARHARQVTRESIAERLGGIALA